MSRPSLAHIDLDALRHNYRLARNIHGGRALAVMKANAYGHGAGPCALALEGIADGFAVAFLEEAVALREAGIRSPILVLEGVFAGQDVATLELLDLWTVVHHEEQLRMIELHEGVPRIGVWLKADSGMGRAGFALQEMPAAHARLLASGKVTEVTLMTHFARADEPDHSATLHQITAFDAATSTLQGDRSLCNSAGVLGWPRACRDWARPGIMLYGADPMPAANSSLRPVMTLESQVFATRWLQTGEPLGYGATFVATRPTRVGLVAIGYADGYPRVAPNGTPVAVDGHATRLIGRVSMDMLTVDLSDLPATGIGSRVELWGAQVGVNDVARRVGTVSYELLCNVKRVPLAYREGAASE